MTKRLRWTLVVFAVFGLIAASCGDDEGDSAVPDTSAAQAAAEAEALPLKPSERCTARADQGGCRWPRPGGGSRRPAEAREQRIQRCRGARGALPRQAAAEALGRGR